MKRILLLVTVASMLAAAMALSRVAQAKPIADTADAQCAKLAIKTLGPSFNPSNYTFIGGTEGSDNFTGDEATAGPDVFCGFGGDDSIQTLDADDIFLGGAGDDLVLNNNGTYYGGAGNERVGTNNGTFYGQEGIDQVLLDNFGTFYGEEGDDVVVFNFTGAPFYGGAGNDVVAGGDEGTFEQ